MCSGTFIASVPFEPIWRAGNIVRRRYVRDCGNTPGHVNHWTRWGFRGSWSPFDVQEISSPLPWTMVRGHPPLTVAVAAVPVFVSAFRRSDALLRTKGGVGCPDRLRWDTQGGHGSSCHRRDLLADVPRRRRRVGQLDDIGVTRRWLDNLGRRGVVQRAAPGVYVIAGAPTTWHQALTVGARSRGRAVLDEP